MVRVSGDRIAGLFAILAVAFAAVLFIGALASAFVPILTRAGLHHATTTPARQLDVGSGPTSRSGDTQGQPSQQSGPDEQNKPNGAPNAVPAAQVTPELKARLNGTQETPANSSPATGKAELRIDLNQGRLCYKLDDVERLTANASAAHIHKAPAGSAGPIVVPLQAPSGGESKDCIGGLDSSLLRNLVDNPEMYYVNVHTSAFADGEIRGQLTKEAEESPDRD